MIPITRKENYLNEIVGWGETAPEKPLTPEEFFFAAILGEAVQAPEPLTRYQMYLAKIAGRNIEIPTPITRLEHFLARAAGMDVTIPTPITREEMFWVDYATVKELSGIPPLTFNAVAGTLKNYRIYGDTVDGESVGDLVTSGEHAGEYKVPVTVEGKNLLQNTATSQTINGVTFTVNNDGSITCNGTATASAPSVLYIPFTLPIKLYELSGCPDSGSNSTYRVDIRNIDYSMYKYNGDTVVDNGTGCLFDGGNKQYCIRIAPGYTCNNLTFYPMIRKADIEDDTYEPYHTPVTTPIYLPESIKMVGDEAEYVDYAEQKQHRVRKNLWDGEIESGSWMGFNADDEPYKVDYNIRCRSSKLIAVKNSSVYTISNHEPSTNVQVIVQYRDNNKKFINEYGWADFPCTFTTPSNAALIEFIIRKPSNLEIMPEDCGDIQLELGSTATEYEPYIENTELDVTLPAMPVLPGTNVLSVGTAVQPSKVYVKYKGERQ